MFKYTITFGPFKVPRYIHAQVYIQPLYFIFEEICDYVYVTEKYIGTTGTIYQNESVKGLFLLRL